MTECCNHCALPDDEGCAYPEYGVAPHYCGPMDTVGAARTKPRSEWPSNFVEDPDTPSVEGKYPGCGIYWCPKCGHGKDSALRVTPC